MKTDISQLIDLKKIDTLLEGFNKSTGFVTAILDLEGNIVSKSGWRCVCTQFHRIHPETSIKCTISDTALANKVGEGETYHYYKCLNGLVDVAVPIVIDSEHIANLFSGQFFFEEPDISFFKKQAEKYGFDEKEYLEALSKVPVVSERKVKTVMDFLLNMTHMISDLAFQKAKQVELNKQISKAKENTEEIEERLNLAMKATHDGIFDWNLESNEIYYSTAWKKMLGYEDQELPNDFSVWEKTTDPEDVKKSWELQQKLIAKQIDRFVMEFKMKHKEGHWVDILSRAEAIFDDKGKAIRVVGAHTDITERKQAERALRESEEKLKSIFNNMTDVVWSISWPDLTHNFISPALEKLYGRSKQELLDNPNLFRDITHPDDKHLTEKAMKQLFEEGKAERECRIIKPDGSIVWVNDRSKMIYDENQLPIRVDGVTRDITEQKRLELKNQALVNIIEQSHDFIGVAEEGQEAFFVNPAGQSMVGLENNETARNTKVLEYFLDEDLPFVKNTILPTLFSKGRWSGEFRFRHFKTGEAIPVLYDLFLTEDPETGELKNITTISRNISEQKKHEEELLRKNNELEEQYFKLETAKEKAEESEQRFRSLIENAPDGVVIIDGHGKFKYVSPNAERLFGYDTDEAIGHSGDEYTHPDDLPMVLKTIERILVDPNQKPKLEYRFKRKNGAYRWIETTFTNLLADKAINGIVLNFSDITERKQIFDQLLISKEKAEESERKFRNALENSPIPTAIVNIDGTTIYLNKQFIQVYGYVIQDIPTIEKWYERAYPDPHYRKSTVDDWNREVEQSIKNGVPTRVKEYEVTCKNGEVKTVAVSGYFEKEIIVGLFQDITERKQVEEALRKSQNNYQNLVENTPDIIYSMNWEGYFTFISNNVSRYGFNPEDMIGHHILEYIHPDDAEVVLNDFQKSFEQETPPKSVFRLASNENTTTWFEDTSRKLIENDQVIGFTGIIRDITKRKEAEEALLKSNQRLESLLDISRKISSTIDQNLIMQMVVDNAVKILGLDTGAIYLKTDDETINLSATTPALPDNFPGELRKAYLKNHPHLQKAMQTGNYVLMEDALTTKLTPEEKNVVDQRQLRTVLYYPIQIREMSHGVLILSSTETPRVFINDELEMLQAFANQAAHIIDNVKNYADLKKYTHELEKQIKQREKAEKELVIAKEKAEESDRLKSAFLANMSHEIRTPMNGILGFADLLKEPDLTSDEQQKYVGIIEKSGARMLNIINQIIDISKIEAGLMELDIKETNINEQIEYIYTFFRPEAEAKGLSLSFSNTLTANAATIHTDREKVYAILTNLVKNAIKYTKKGAIELGYVLTDTTNKPVERIGSELGEQSITPELRFYVKDTGIGIPKDRQQAIFERFIQADIEDRMAFQGAGLGLAITKAYVEMLGGKVWVESVEGAGSTFYFTLPYNTRPINNPAEISSTYSEPNNEIRKLKILIAEDEEVSELLIDNYIKMYGKEILKARTGVEAVEVSRSNPDIDLILMDIRMPYMDGYEATKQIRKFNKEVVIIAQTAYGLTGDREKAIDAGCDDYITKPLNRKALQALIQKNFKR